MSWLVALLGYLLNRVAHDARVALARHVVQRLDRVLRNRGLSNRRLARLARFEDRLTRLVRAILLSRMHVLAGYGEYLRVERKPFRRLATSHAELRGRLDWLLGALGEDEADVDRVCRRLMRLSNHVRARRARARLPRRTSRTVARLAGFRATIACDISPRELELSG